MDDAKISLVKGCIGYYPYNGSWRSYELRPGDELDLVERNGDVVVVRSYLGPHYAQHMYVKMEDLGMEK